MAHELATHGLAHEKAKELKKHLKEMHVRQLHDGTHHVALHDGKGGMTEHGAADLDQVHDLMEEHMGDPEANPQEEAAE